MIEEDLGGKWSGELVKEEGSGGEGKDHDESSEIDGEGSGKSL